MFSYLEGVLKKVSETETCVNVNGVGYTVQLPTSYHVKIVEGETYSFCIATVVRENAIDLYGFFSALEKRWFVQLMNVQGVGGKLALAILSALTCSEIYDAIMQKKCEAFEMVSGVGKKMAERLVRELYDRVGDLASQDSTHAPAGVAMTKVELIQSLEKLGYSQYELRETVESVLEEFPGDSVESLLMKVLQKVGKR